MEVLLLNKAIRFMIYGIATGRKDIVEFCLLVLADYLTEEEMIELIDDLQSAIYTEYANPMYFIMHDWNPETTESFPSLAHVKFYD